MSKNQIGYSLIFVETLKPYNKKTKKFEPFDVTENFYVIQNQTAIAELEKVKKRFNDRLDNFYLPLDHRQTLKEVFEQIDQQIKELKGEL